MISFIWLCLHKVDDSKENTQGRKCAGDELRRGRHFSPSGEIENKVSSEPTADFLENQTESSAMNLILRAFGTVPLLWSQGLQES